MIENIIDDIRQVCLDNDLKEAKEFFSVDNIPDSIVDDGFCFAPVVIAPGELIRSDNRAKVNNFVGEFKIFVSGKLTANSLIARMKALAIKIELVLKSILAIDCGSDEKDRIEFTGSVSTVTGAIIVYEIDLRINYRA